LDNVVHFDNQALQLPKIKGVTTLAGEGIVASILQPDKARSEQDHLIA